MTDFRYSDKASDLEKKVQAFLADSVYPAEQAYEQQTGANRRTGTPFRTLSVITDLKSAGRIVPMSSA